MIRFDKRICSGFFDDRTELAKALLPWEGKAHCYVLLNPINPTILDEVDADGHPLRTYGRLREFATHTTSDRHILRRVWFPVDVDRTGHPIPRRPTRNSRRR